MGKKYETLDSKEVWNGHIFRVRVDQVRMPAGHIAEREVISHAGAVGIVPVTARSEVILVRQYRHAIEDYLLEIPAGKLDRVETPLECAFRELKEEAGADATELVELAQFYNSPGYSSELFHLYGALVANIGEVQPDGEEEQDMERVIIPLSEALEMTTGGEINDAKTVIGLFLADRWVQNQS